MVLLRWRSSWFLISRETFKVLQKDTLELAIHSICLKDLHDRGCLRLKQVLSREFKSTSPPLTFFPPPPPPPFSVPEGNAFIGQQWASNIKIIWHGKLRVHKMGALTNGLHHAFAAPSPPPKDWHGGPFPTHGELARVLSLTMRLTRTANPQCLFSPQWPETWLSLSCANILGRFEVCFQKFG